MNCPHCNTLINLFENILGQLGRLIHIRCRHCGGDFYMDEGQLGEVD